MIVAHHYNRTEIAGCRASSDAKC